MADGRKANGKWIDRWREDGVQCQRTFDRKRDRDAFRDRRRRAQQLGHVVAQELLLEGDPPLSEWVEDWWARHAVPNLEASTRATHKLQWAKWILPRLGTYRLRQITPRVINTQLVEKMRAAGAGEPTVRRTLAVLQGMLALAETEERIPRNPVALVSKPPALTERQVPPVLPAVVEQLRQRILRTRGPVGLRDATMVSVLAYAGLRPQEMLALAWEDVLFEQRKLFIHRKNVDGEIFGYTKTRRHRRVDLLAPLAQDLTEWRLASRAGAELVFDRPRDGDPWRKHDFANWREDVYRPHAEHVGLETPVPYDLRGSFVSLLAWEGRTMLEVSGQAGHGVDVCERYYARIFEQAPLERRDAEAAIRAARARPAMELAR